MKIACSSATFAAVLSANELTLLEWLDICANELEVDGIVFDIAHLVRTDADYLAQMKKAAADLGLTVAGLEVAEPVNRESTRAESFEIALALGAPLLVVRAPAAEEDANAWGDFTAAIKAFASAGKHANVTLALRNVAGTLCATPSDLPRVAKDVDSSWLRFALDVAGSESVDGILAKTAIASVALLDPSTFAMPGDAEARSLIARLARFRGFVTIEGTANPNDGAFHAAIERFAAQRANALAGSASAS